jgi:DNA-binding NtrC family response regulator
MSAKNKVLIVDDDPNVCLTVREALQPLGCAIATAGTGEEALEDLKGDSYTVLLLDLKLPGMDGLEVLRRLREISPAARPILMTAHGRVADAVEAMKLGAVDFLQKPFTPAELRRTVAAVIDRSTLPDSPTADYSTMIEYAKKCIGDYRFAEAAAHLKQAISCEPSRPEAFNLLGALQEIQGGDPAEALRNYHAALALDSSYAPALKNIERISGENKYRRGHIDIDDRR